MGEKLGEKVGEKTGEKVGESLGEIHKLNLCHGMDWRLLIIECINNPAKLEEKKPFMSAETILGLNFFFGFFLAR